MGLISDKAPATDSLSPQGIRAKMAIPPELKAEYDTLVAAGRKIMYSPQVTQAIQGTLQEQSGTAEKLSDLGVAVIGLLFSQAGKNASKQLLIPVAIELLTEGADLLRKAGVKVQPDDIAEGVATMLQQIFQMAGLGPEQLAQLAQQSKDSNTVQPQPAAQGEAAPAAPAQEQ